MPKFIGEAVQVESEGVEPTAFRWRGREHRIRRIRQSWFDVGFGPKGSSIKKGWWQRKRRTFYQVETYDGHLFELYLDRASRGKQWVLYRRLDDDSI